jgi:FemAB-related protein (PEP-CTERM system-associated)
MISRSQALAMAEQAQAAEEASRSVIVSADVSPEQWNQFVRIRKDATGYHLWEWRNVFERALGHRCHYLVAREGSQIVGLLPLVEVRSWPFGRALSSLPYVNYGGVLAATDAARNALVAEAARLASARSLDYVVLRHRRRLCPELPARTHKVTMVLPLLLDRDAMWNALDRKVRNQIRKAEKSGLTTVVGGEELLDDFYAVFARNMRDLGTPVYSRSLFASIVSNFPRDAKLHLARLNGQTIAGAFSYAFGDTIEVPSASSLREHRALCPNHLLYWSIISDAIAEGRKVFDFGRSTPNDGTYHFKEQWGAAPEQLWWEYQLTAGARVPADDRQSAKFHAAIEAWKRLPLSVATLVGPRIARSIP